MPLGTELINCKPSKLAIADTKNNRTMADTKNNNDDDDVVEGKGEASWRVIATGSSEMMVM